MRSTVTVSAIILLLFATCKKDHSATYAGNFYIRIPLVENDYTYFFRSVYYNELDFIYNNTGDKTVWQFIPAGDNQYNIAVADSASILVTDFEGTPRGDVALFPKVSGMASHQLFKIIKDRHSDRVYIQSVYSGKFIVIEYCFKISDTWGKNVALADSANCNAYANVGSSAQADTCYCINSYQLERR